jgi:hypothetical protein
MKNSVHILSILVFVLTPVMVFGQSQECKTSAENKVGELIRIKDVAPSGVLSPACYKYTREATSVVDTIGKMFMKIDPNPIGSHAEWCRVFVPTDSITTPDHSLANYIYDASYQPYICDAGKIKPNGKANLWVFVGINDTYAAGTTVVKDLNRDLGDSLFTLSPQRGTIGGYPMFYPDAGGDPDNPQREYYSVLIHYPGKLPYIPISKGEFLEMSLKMIDVNEADFFELCEKQTAKGQQRDPDNEERMRQNYQVMRENIKAQQKLNEKTLSQPAILREPGWSIISIGNTDATERIFTTANRGYQLVRRNPGYVDKTREKWKPQYIWVKWQKSLSTFYPKNTQIFDTVMREKFDFARLGRLLTE